MGDRLDGWRQTVADWSRGRSWIARLPLWLFFVYLAARYLRDPRYQSVFGGLNLGIHELGHVVFGPFGQTLGIAGGTILQCAAPVVSVVMFCRQRDAFALSFSCAWMATNLYGVAVYMADARAMAMPLVSPFGGDVYHDWNYLLDRAGWLAYDTRLASWVRMLAAAFMLASLVYGAWVLWVMARPEDGRNGPQTTDDGPLRENTTEH